MPAASPEKHMHQGTNKLLRMENEATTPSDIPLPGQAAEVTSQTLLTPTPSFFTISYTLVSIFYPEPINPTSQLPTDAIQVTCDQLSDMLHQSYVHGSEHIWKVQFVLANEIYKPSMSRTCSQLLLILWSMRK